MRWGRSTSSFPTATMLSWPRRCAYALQLDWDVAARHVAAGRGASAPASLRAAGVEPVIMLTDPTPPVLTDTIIL